MHTIYRPKAMISRWLSSPEYLVYNTGLNCKQSEQCFYYWNSADKLKPKIIGSVYQMRWALFDPCVSPSTERTDTFGTFIRLNMSYVKPCINERPLVVSSHSIKVCYSHSVYLISHPFEAHIPYANQYDSVCIAHTVFLPVLCLCYTRALMPLESLSANRVQETDLTVIEIASQCLHVFTLPNSFITYLLSPDLTLIGSDTREPNSSGFISKRQYIAVFCCQWWPIRHHTHRDRHTDIECLIRQYW